MITIVFFKIQGSIFRFQVFFHSVPTMIVTTSCLQKLQALLNGVFMFLLFHDEVQMPLKVRLRNYRCVSPKDQL